MLWSLARGSVGHFWEQVHAEEHGESAFWFENQLVSISQRSQGLKNWLCERCVLDNQKRVKFSSDLASSTIQQVHFVMTKTAWTTSIFKRKFEGISAGPVQKKDNQPPMSCNSKRVTQKPAERKDVVAFTSGDRGTFLRPQKGCAVLWEYDGSLR